MKSLIFIWILLLSTLILSAQDEVHMLAGYHYEGKITSVTESKVVMRRTNNQVASISKADIWKLVYENGREVIINEPFEEVEARIGKINSQKTLEEIIRDGNDVEVEVAYYNLIRKGYQYEFRNKNMSDFIERFPDSKYRRELLGMARFNRKIKEHKEIGFKCESPFTPEVDDSKGDLQLKFTDELGVSHTFSVALNLKFIRTYGKKYKMNDASEWKNDYAIGFTLDESPEPVVFKDQYKLMDAQGDNPHMIFLSNVVFGDFNVNGQIGIGTNVGKEDGENIIDISLEVDYLKW